MTDASPAPAQDSPRGRLALVAGLARQPLTPRGQRAQNVAEALGGRWDVELIAFPAPGSADGGAPLAGRVFWRRVLGYLAGLVLLDRWEPWTVRRLRRWRPEVDAALLIASPWSPAVRAARKLAKRGISYVVDVGDPWVLTEGTPLPRTIATWRRKRAERLLWRGASGAVVTTRQQADRLARLFPHLQILIRANGYAPIAEPVAAGNPARRAPGSLRLVHLGSLSPVRVDVCPLLAELRRSGRWSSIVFAQFGDDYAGVLGRLPEGIELEHCPVRPWQEVLAAAAEFDAAVALGNQLGYLLPSKAIQYLTLPIPRIAVTAGERDDALAEFAAAQPAWLVAYAGEPGLAERVAAHVEREWTAAELAPPPGEAWPRVAAEVATFVEGCLRGGGGAASPAARGEPAPAAGGVR
ncbi:MAG TPA: glycosyltransferase [Solirubrobacterales bacterium]|jgi:hypothetical protein